MANVQQMYAAAVAAHGATKVARATKLPRTTILSIAAGGARESTLALAEKRLDALVLLAAR